MFKAFNLIVLVCLATSITLLLQFAEEEPIPIAVAQTPPEPELPFLIERGQAYSHTLNGYVDGKMKVTTQTNLPNYILNDFGKYVPYILTEDPTTYKIETSDGSLIFNKEGCNAVFYNPGRVNQITDTPLVNSESWVIHQKDLTTNSTWEYITDVNNAVCTNTIYEDEGSIILESIKTVSNVATSSIKYIKNEGFGFKILSQVTNDNPSWTNNTMGYIETINIPDTINLNGTDYYIPDNNGTFFDHNFFNTTNTKAIMLGSELKYFVDVGVSNLWGATLIYEGGQSKISFDYSFNDEATPIGEAYEIDPFFFEAIASTYISRMTGQGGVNCDPVGNNIQIGFTSEAAPNKKGTTSPAVPSCTYVAYEADISMLVSGAEITEVNMTFGVSTSPGFGRPCQYTHMDNQPSSLGTSGSAAEELRDDILNGTVYFSSPTDDICDDALPGVEYNFGATAISDLQDNLNSGDGWFAIGQSYINYVRDGFTTTSFLGSEPVVFKITYLANNFTVNIPASYSFDVETFLGNDVTCESADTIFNRTGSEALTFLSPTTVAGTCFRSGHEFSLDTIPDNAQVVTVGLQQESTVVNGSPDNGGCNIRSIEFQPSIIIVPQDLYDDIGDGKEYALLDSGCTTVGTTLSDFGFNGTERLQNHINAQLDWFAVGQTIIGDPTRASGTFNKSYDSKHSSAFLVVTFAVPPGPDPGQPQNLTATTNLISSIDLDWDAVNATEVTNYKIYNSSTGSPPFDLLSTIGNVTSFSDTGLPVGFSMDYKVASFFFPDQESINSTVASGTTLPDQGLPDPPTIISAGANITNIDVIWNDSITPNITRYFVERSLDASGPFTIVGSTPNVTSFIDVNVQFDTLFFYRVFSENGTFNPFNGTSSSNAVVTSNDVPKEPTNLFAEYFNPTQVDLTFDPPVDIGEGSPTTGLSILNHTVFSQNVTGGEEYIFEANTTDSFFNKTGVNQPDIYSFIVKTCNELGCGPNSTSFFIGQPDLPDAILDLDFFDLTFSSVIINWTTPFLGGGTLQDGYQINFTTPFAEPLTILVADTQSAVTEFTVSDLTELTQYSFRVTAINEVGVNATGLILNITTLDDFIEQNFTVGEIGNENITSIDAVNLDVIPILFSRNDINDTTIELTATYSENIDLACQFNYKFAMTESFFDAPLITTPVGGGKVETTFLFLDFENEVVDVFCWNEVNNETALYILTQTNFPLLQQLEAFRAGDFGTDGMFGVIDLITLMVIIISMIGFNRVNETVGALFNIIFIGSLAFFGIIELSTTVFSAIALVLMLVIITTRKV